MKKDITKYNEITVIGAGAWGTAIAKQLVRNKKNKVNIFAREKTVTKEINEKKTNSVYLKEIDLSGIKASYEPQIVDKSDILYLVTPSQFMRNTLEKIKEYINKNAIIVICSKGIENNTLNLMSDIVKKELPLNKLCVLSGPSFAIEVAKGLPAAVTLAGEDNVTKKVAMSIKSKKFRPYFSNDIIGCEVAGAVKNVLAIACGIAIGLDLGENAKAALITRGCNEIKTLIKALNGNPKTILSLAGIGDIMLTCSSEQSRNTSFGIKFAKGKSIEEINKSSSSITEGLASCKSVYETAKKLNISMPIVETVKNIIIDNKDKEKAIIDLLSRPLKHEGEF